MWAKPGLIPLLFCIFIVGSEKVVKQYLAKNSSNLSLIFAYILSTYPNTSIAKVMVLNRAEEIIFLKRHKTNNDLIITKPWLKIAKCNYFADGEIGENVNF